ncbi:tubulin-tyrosine ligase [Dothidotthia symphoricarpi CBS 119687]|uniref:Tubulin-tyrosine ligase n=1 Tax=Dothidotthia symphoricarpi CBS 119687 TaxID=1392245 RepID=A0A6A6AMV9_9PLEO|nr:tubulin-tyrosine ligase [Dothidotthia symphoricarpi CBS 119687]KAF2133120.1 tubulin-tyrosine ligase [Dothidotthia symphoricarpi CBS 119687]
MASPTNPPADKSPDPTIYCLINYEDTYVQPLLLTALSTHLPAHTYKLITTLSDLPTPSSPLLQFLQYESLSWDHLLAHPTTSLANAYIIRKALIRKHYLSTTVANWCVKYPESVLRRHVMPSVEFEVDYVEFLDDALVEAWELRESWGRNEVGGGEREREWWILKPGMSERGQGVRLFSSEEELVRIFEGWEPDSDEEDEEDARSDDDTNDKDYKSLSDGIITSQLRHFIAQPYIHPPLLLYPSTSPQQDLRKFHIRTYILASGALKIHIYRPMLALFAASPYTPPSTTTPPDLSAHLTNTCLQNSTTRAGSVSLFWDLPSTLPVQPPYTPSITANASWKDDIFSQIRSITSETFTAAARGMGTHFQPLPNAFEVFGLDFMVGVEADGSLRAWLLEVNAFPDFGQTGEGLRGVVGGLMGSVVGVAVGGFFGVGGEGGGDMVEVLDLDLGRR